MKPERPKIKIGPDITDWIFESIGLVILILIIGFPSYYYNQLPEIIPIAGSLISQ